MTSDHAFIERTQRYAVLQRIGSGGMGVVYKVLDRERNAVVALKTMHRRDPMSLYRFKREFRALADVKHPNLVNLYELSSIDDVWFFTMEYVEGVGFLDFVFNDRPTDGGGSSDAEESGTNDLTQHETSTAMVKAARPRTRALLFDRLRSSLIQLASGVQALHDAGHLHRDIKPSNVRVTREGRVVLLDFGLVTTPRQSGHWEQTGNVLLGTPAYMSPEQATGGELSTASDWYSVGVMLYEALTGSCPFQIPDTPISLIDLLEKKRRDTPPPPRLIASDVPDDLNEVCVELIRAAPEHRLQGRQLHAKLLAGTDSASIGVDGAPLPGTDSPVCFVGRREHLNALYAALSDVRPGHPSVVHLHGSSGMGKSTLLRQFLDGADIRDHTVVLEGRCYEQESVPYKALDSVVDALSSYLASLPPVELKAMLPGDVGELARVFPVLERIDAIANAPFDRTRASDPHSRRRRAFQAFRELLRGISQQHRIIVAIDDLQWGDVDSAVIMDELLRPPDAPAVLLIGTYRTDEAKGSAFLRQHVESMHGLSEWLAYREILVGPLAVDEAGEMAAALLGTDGAATQDVVTESRGHPYFLRELTRHLQNLGSDGGGRSATAVVTLTDMLRDRIRRLPDQSRHLLTVIAVAGHPIEQRVVFEAAGFTSDVHPALERLHLEHLVRRRRSDHDALIECFHDRIREIAVNEIPAVTLRRLHHDLGRALESYGGADPESLAGHFEAAGDHDKAAAYSAAAGDAASELLAFDWAAELYCRSRALVKDDPPKYFELTRKAGRAFANAGRGTEAAEKFLEAAASAEPAQALELRRQAAGQLLASGHIDEGMTVIRDLLQALGMRYPPTPRRALAALVWRRLAVRLRGYRFQSHPESAIPAATLAKLDTCRTIAEGLAMVDNIRGAHFQARTLLLSLRAGEPSRVSLALSLEAGFSATSGSPNRSRAFTLAARAMDIAQSAGNAQALGRATFAHGLTHYLVGEWRLAYEHTARAVEILRDRCIGVTWDLTSAQRFQLGSLNYLGELREIGARTPVLLEDARRRGDLYLSTDLHCRDYHLHWLAADNPAAGRRGVEAAISQWSQHGFLLQHYNAMLGLAQCELYEAQPLDAWKRLEEVWPKLTGSLLMRVQVLRAEVHFLRARTALALFADSHDARLLERAVRDIERIEKEKVRWTRPLALVLRAGVACAGNQYEIGAALLKQAASEFENADMSLHAAAARYQLGRIADGDDRQTARAMAEDWMSSQGVRNPPALAALFVPIAGLRL